MSHASSAKSIANACRRAAEGQTRCVPAPGNHCPQRLRCATTGSDRKGLEVDATVVWRALRWCPMFIDRRMVTS